MKKIPCQLSVMLCLSLALNLPLAADATFNFTEKDGQGKSTASAIYVKQQKIHLATQGGDTNAYSLFDAAEQKLYHISHPEKAYMAIDEKIMDKQMQIMQQQMQHMMEQMQSQMQSMPPERQQQMQQMMAEIKQGKMPGMASIDKQVVNSGKKHSIAGLPCEMTEIYIDGHKVEEQCLVNTADLPVSADDRKTIDAMQIVMNKIAEKAASMGGQTDMTSGLQGLPILTRAYNPQGKIVREIQLSNMSTTAVDPVKMVIPAGYTSQQTPF